MRFSKIQYIVLTIIALFSALVIILITIAKNKTDEILPQIQTMPGASLPPIGENIENSAKIEIETGNTFDMGVIPNDKETTKKLKIYNRGKSPLNLRFIQTSCACTQGTIPPGQEIIPPGGEGHILVTVFPTRVAGFYSEKTLTIYSNDPKNSPLELKVIARVDPEFSIEPENIDFGEINKGSTKDLTIIITQKNMKKPLEIYKIYERGLPESIPNDITYSIKKIENTNTPQYSLTLRVEPNIAPGEFNRMFFISTNIDRYPEVPIKVKGKINAPYKINIPFPHPILLNPITNESTKQLIIEVDEENAPLEIVSYEVEPKIFSASPNIINRKIIFNIQTQDVSNETYGLLTITLKSNRQSYEDRVLLKNPGKLKIQ